MQSGITVSKELQDAFNELVSTPTQRGLLVTINNESLTPLAALPSTTTDFHSDLSTLPAHLKKDAASYVILRRYQNAPDGYVAVTYVPDSAPVRQKMLFASTRLTLVRELGTERFRESIFVTEMKELEPEGWRKHDASGALKAPLTEEEESLKGIKEAEAEERGGTARRRLETGGRLTIAMNDEARGALEGFGQGADNLLQLVRSIMQVSTWEKLMQARKSMWQPKRSNLPRLARQMQRGWLLRFRQRNLAILSSSIRILSREPNSHLSYSYILAPRVRR